MKRAIQHSKELCARKLGYRGEYSTGYVTVWQELGAQSGKRPAMISLIPPADGQHIAPIRERRVSVETANVVWFLRQKRIVSVRAQTWRTRMGEFAILSRIREGGDGGLERMAKSVSNRMQ